MEIIKIIDLNIYHYNNIIKIKELFSEYINIKLKKLDDNKLEINFIGEENEIYSKEFFNYLIILESRNEDWYFFMEYLFWLM